MAQAVGALPPNVLGVLEALMDNVVDPTVPFDWVAQMAVLEAVRFAPLLSVLFRFYSGSGSSALILNAHMTSCLRQLPCPLLCASRTRQTHARRQSNGLAACLTQVRTTQPKPRAQERGDLAQDSAPHDVPAPRGARGASPTRPDCSAGTSQAQRGWTAERHASHLAQPSSLVRALRPAVTRVVAPVPGLEPDVCAACRPQLEQCHEGPLGLADLAAVLLAMEGPGAVDLCNPRVVQPPSPRRCVRPAWACWTRRS